VTPGHLRDSVALCPPLIITEVQIDEMSPVAPF
jgi:hypothetical protein